MLVLLLKPLLLAVQLIASSLVSAVSTTSRQLHTAYSSSGVIQALVGCFFCCFLYVGSLYIWSGLPRNHPATIKRRMVSVLLACCLTWVPVYLALPKRDLHGKALPHLLVVLGITSRHALQAVVYPLLHCAILFCCPLAFTLWETGAEVAPAVYQWAGRMLSSLVRCQVQGLVAATAAPFADEHLWLWRNLVVAPVTEEFVFRACMAPLLLLGGCSLTTTVFVTPLIFGAAHLHHLHDLITYQGFPLGRALIMVLFQYMYTTLFGWYATWLLLRSGSLLAPIAAHAFCNWMGVPRFRDMSRLFGTPMLLVGTAGSIAAFAYLFQPLTQPALYGGPLRVV